MPALDDLGLDRNLYKAPLDGDTWDASIIAATNADNPIDPIATGNAATDVNNGSVTLDGAVITPGTIPPGTLDVSNWGWTQTCAFSSASATQVNWGAGSFVSANGVTYTISSGNTGTMAAKTYIYLDLNVSSSTYQHTTTSGNSVGVGKVLIAVAQNGASTATFNLNVATQIVGDNILANTIDASKIVAGSITATQISASYVYAGTIVASQITTGTLTGIVIQTQSSGQRVVLTSTLAQFFNSSGTEIVETYADSSSYLIKGMQSSSSIALDAGSAGSTVFLVNGTSYARINASGLTPTSSGGLDLGNISFKWNDIWNTGIHVYKGINQPVTYVGYCSGTSISTTNSAFTLTNPSTGKYTITHGFGTTNYTAVLTTLRASGGGAYVCKVEARNNNSLQVTVFDDTGTVQNGDFMFNISLLT